MVEVETGATRFSRGMKVGLESPVDGLASIGGVKSDESRRDIFGSRKEKGAGIDRWAPAARERKEGEGAGQRG